MMSFVKRVSSDALQGKSINVSVAFRDAIIKGLAKGLNEGAKLGLDHDKAVLANIERINREFPTFFNDVNALMSRYTATIEKNKRKEEFAHFIDMVYNIVKILDLDDIKYGVQPKRDEGSKKFIVAATPDDLKNIINSMTKDAILLRNASLTQTDPIKSAILKNAAESEFKKIDLLKKSESPFPRTYIFN